MLLLYFAFSCVSIGSATGIQEEEKCYGSDFYLPISTGRLYFTSRIGGIRTLLIENWKAKDQRIHITYRTVTVPNLSERDDGTFSLEAEDGKVRKAIRLHILDCAHEITKTYGNQYSYDVPRQAEFLEFSPSHTVDEPKVLWNRSDPQALRGRGQIRRGVWEISIITYADKGYYNFRRKDNTLLSRIQINVQEATTYYEPKLNEGFVIKKPIANEVWTLTFTPKKSTKRISLMEDGHLISEVDGMSSPFAGRIRVLHDGIEINPVESTDTGTFEFRDPQGNLAMTVHVEVEQGPMSTFVLVGLIVGVIVVVLIGCCCVRKCIEKKVYSTAQTAAAPAVYHHDVNQPAGYSAHQTTNPLLSREPATTSWEPPAYNSLNIPVSPRQPEVTAPAGQGAAPGSSPDYDWLSSDPGPQFEIRGVGLSTVGPLSSPTTLSDVYTSDKLNFL